MNEDQQTMTEEEWEEAYEQSHMNRNDDIDRMTAVNQVMGSVFDEHKKELYKCILDKNQDGQDCLINMMIDEMVEKAGGVIGKSDAQEFIDEHLPSTQEPIDDEESGQWNEELYKEHEERWLAMEQIKGEVYEEYESEFMTTLESLGDLINNAAMKMVDEAGSFISADEAKMFLYGKLKEKIEGLF